MLNLDIKFQEFLENINLTDGKVKELRTGRDAIRKKIKDAFLEKGIMQPKFRMQGSFSMGTIIQTLPDIEYDLDDGVYLQHFNNSEKSQWDSPQVVHDLIFDIVSSHTYIVEDKKPCIRVTYANSYHIDIPIYIIKDEIAYLAHLDKGWIVSDPKALRDWLSEEVKAKGKTLLDIVKLTKAWKDFVNYKGEKIDFCGLAITLILSNNFTNNEKIVDTLLLTLQSVLESLENSFKCKKPVTPYDDLFDQHTYSEQRNLINEIELFIKNLKIAINSKNEKEACNKLKEVFGDRFPSGNVNTTNQQFIKTKAPTILHDDARSA